MSGRSEEFREFARDRGWPLQQAAYLLCGDWHSAQDVVQETLIKAYRHWPRVKRADNPDAYVRENLAQRGARPLAPPGKGGARRGLSRARPCPTQATTSPAATGCCKRCSSSRSSSG